MTPYQDPIRRADHREGEALTISFSHSESADARSVAGDMRKSEESKRQTEYRVLVVNDMPDQLEMIGHLLRKSGYGVVTALNGREGLDVAQDQWTITRRPIAKSAEIYFAVYVNLLSQL